MEKIMKNKMKLNKTDIIYNRGFILFGGNVFAIGKAYPNETVGYDGYESICVTINAAKPGVIFAFFEYKTHADDVDVSELTEDELCDWENITEISAYKGEYKMGSGNKFENIQNDIDIYQSIHDFNGFIKFIDNPSGKQIRVHQMAHVI